MSADSKKSPLEQFLAWKSEVMHLPEDEAHKLVLATTNAKGFPHARVVLCKSADSRGLVFYTNLRSRKAQEIGENPRVSLCFHWPQIERQICIDGLASPLSSHEVDAYFANRSRGSKIGAWASSHQSHPIRPQDLEKRFLSYQEKFGPGDEVPRPEYWGGFRVRPLAVEFWVMGDHRLHRRELFDCSEQGWADRLPYETLSP